MHEGEHAAAKRLFRDVESVTESEGYARSEEGEGLEQVASGVEKEEVRSTRPVQEWRRVLMSRERDVSVAKG